VLKSIAAIAAIAAIPMLFGRRRAGCRTGGHRRRQGTRRLGGDAAASDHADQESQSLRLHQIPTSTVASGSGNFTAVFDAANMWYGDQAHRPELFLYQLFSCDGRDAVLQQLPLLRPPAAPAACRQTPHRVLQHRRRARGSRRPASGFGVF